MRGSDRDDADAALLSAELAWDTAARPPSPLWHRMLKVDDAQTEQDLSSVGRARGRRMSITC